MVSQCTYEENRLIDGGDLGLKRPVELSLQQACERSGEFDSRSLASV